MWWISDVMSSPSFQQIADTSFYFFFFCHVLRVNTKTYLYLAVVYTASSADTFSEEKESELEIGIPSQFVGLLYIAGDIWVYISCWCQLWIVRWPIFPLLPQTAISYCFCCRLIFFPNNFWLPYVYLYTENAAAVRNLCKRRSCTKMENDKRLSWCPASIITLSLHASFLSKEGTRGIGANQKEDVSLLCYSRRQMRMLQIGAHKQTTSVVVVI